MLDIVFFIAIVIALCYRFTVFHHYTVKAEVVSSNKHTTVFEGEIEGKTRRLETDKLHNLSVGKRYWIFVDKKDYTNISKAKDFYLYLGILALVFIFVIL